MCAGIFKPFSQTSPSFFNAFISRIRYICKNYQFRCFLSCLIDEFKPLVRRESFFCGKCKKVFVGKITVSGFSVDVRSRIYNKFDTGSAPAAFFRSHQLLDVARCRSGCNIKRVAEFYISNCYRQENEVFTAIHLYLSYFLLLLNFKLHYCYR